MTRSIRLAAAALAGALMVFATGASGQAVPPGTDDEIRARLAPVGTVCRTGETCGGVQAVADSGGTAAAGMSGEKVYSTFCFACHATGVSESPILGDAEAWAPRIAKGTDVLWENTVNGIGLMPMKGTCMNCSDDELRAAMDYLIAGE